MKKCNKYTLQALILSAVGVAGTVLWQKKDLVQAVIQLRQFPEGWVQIGQQPQVFLTRADEQGQENLFTYLSNGPWRLVDQVADGFFWMNDKEEILLLTQKKFLKDYWTWTASRSFFDTPPQEASAEAEPTDTEQADADVAPQEPDAESEQPAAEQHDAAQSGAEPHSASSSDEDEDEEDPSIACDCLS